MRRLSNNCLGAAGAAALAPALAANGGLTSINLYGNKLCGGVWTDDWSDYKAEQDGNYTAKGIIAIADALRVNGGLTALDLSLNNLDDEGVSAVCEAIQSNKETKLASLNFRQNNIGPVGANALAAMVAVTGSLTECGLSYNNMSKEGEALIRKAVEGKAGFKLHL